MSALFPKCGSESIYSMYILPFPVWECGIAPVLGRRVILLDTLTTIPRKWCFLSNHRVLCGNHAVTKKSIAL